MTPAEREACLTAKRLLETHSWDELVRIYRHFPVGVRFFIEDPYYLNSKGILYPEVLRCTEEMNNGEYNEAVLTGSIGVGKTTIAVYGLAYQVYLLSCMRNPHKEFGLDPSSEIEMIFQSLNAGLAKDVDYTRFRALIAKSQYFKENYPFDTSLEATMKFPNRIIIKPVSGEASGSIGQNVIGGCIDEVNFMAVVESSKMSVDGGVYDQAMSLYNSIAARRRSRFNVKGKMPGMLYLVSSRSYPGQFTDIKEEEAAREIERTGRTDIYIYDKRVWDIKDRSLFQDETFHVFVGDAARKPRIMEPDEEIPPEDAHLVDTIPMDFYKNFDADIMTALRDIAGRATIALHPFIQSRESVFSAQRKTFNPFGREEVDFVTTKLAINFDQIRDKEVPRFVHIDLSKSGDCTGITMGTVFDFKQVVIGDSMEFLPNIWIDAMLSVRAPKGGEILYEKIRQVIYALRDKGVNIKWVTFDSFQSVDITQLFRQQGFIVGYQSMDTTPDPYHFTKMAFQQGRVSMPTNSIVTGELCALEKDAKTGKIDHPPKGRKDVSDSLAGVIYGLTMRREIWSRCGIPIGAIPAQLRTTINSESMEKRDSKVKKATEKVM